MNVDKHFLGGLERVGLALFLPFMAIRLTILFSPAGAEMGGFGYAYILLVFPAVLTVCFLLVMSAKKELEKVVFSPFVHDFGMALITVGIGLMPALLFATTPERLRTGLGPYHVSLIWVGWLVVFTLYLVALPWLVRLVSEPNKG